MDCPVSFIVKTLFWASFWDNYDGSTLRITRIDPLNKHKLPSLGHLVEVVRAGKRGSSVVKEESEVTLVGEPEGEGEEEERCERGEDAFEEPAAAAGVGGIVAAEVEDGLGEVGGLGADCDFFPQGIGARAVSLVTPFEELVEHAGFLLARRVGGSSEGLGEEAPEKGVGWVGLSDGVLQTPEELTEFAKAEVDFVRGGFLAGGDFGHDGEGVVAEEGGEVAVRQKGAQAVEFVSG